MISSSSHSQTVAGSIILLMLAFFVLQVSAFPFEMRPDEYKAIEYFTGFFSNDLVRSSEVFTRVVLLCGNLVVMAVLAHMGLINRQTLIIACLWPMTVFLFSKIYWEFFVFPFCLIRHDLRAAQEAALLAFFGLLIALTHEANIAVMMMFRSILLAQKLGFRRSAPIAFAGTGAALSAAMSTGIGASLPFIGSHIARFSWTRDVVNPEYSVFETAAIFLTSFHFFTLHTGLWIIDAAFSLAVVLVIVLNPGALDRFAANWPALLAFLCVVLGLTEITHAFQNARYYFFFMPLIGALAAPKSYPAIGLLGLTHVLFKTLEVFWFD